MSFIVKILSSRLIGLAGISFTYFYLTALPGRPQSIILWFTNFLIVVLSCCIIYTAPSRTISIFKICGVFFLLFFGITPILEYKMDIKYWGGASVSEYNYILTNTIIIIGIFLFWLFYKASCVLVGSIEKTDFEYCLHRIVENEMGLLRLVIPQYGCLLLILWFFDFNYYNLIFRGGDFIGDVISDNKAAGLVVNNFLRPFCFSVAILYFFIIRQYGKLNVIWSLIFLPVALLVCFPSSLARFSIAALYIPLILVLFPRIFDNGFLLINALILSFVTIFPFFDAFRNVEKDFSFANIAIGFDAGFFVAGHFDAYQNFLRTIELDIVTDGFQLLGAILFFVPRVLWIDKPIGSGELLAQKANLGFSNISQSLPAEGYVNFGLLGVFLFLAIAAYIAAKLDSNFWFNKKSSLRSIYSLYYFQIIGLTIFILRGDLNNAIAYTSGFLLSMAVTFRILKSRAILVGSRSIF